jgi:hypothetical protein
MSEIRVAMDDVLRPLNAKFGSTRSRAATNFLSMHGATVCFCLSTVFRFVRSLCRTVRGTMFNPSPQLMARQVDEIVDYSRHALLTGSTPFG